jgi:hypothetical protein
MNNNKVKDDSLAKLQLLLGINREFTENDWWHIVGHYIASLKIKPQHGMYVPNPDIIRQSPSVYDIHQILASSSANHPSTAVPRK